MTDEDKKYLVPTNYIPTGKADNSSQLPGQIVGGAIAVGAGAGAIAGGKAFINPWLEKQQLKNNTIKPFMARYGIPAGIPTSSLQSHIGDRIAELNTISTKQNTIHSDAMQKFDMGVKQNTEDAADNLANNYPAWRRSVSTDYGNQLNGLQDRISKMGVSFDADAFNKNVIEKTADTLAGRGMDMQAAKLRAYAASRESGILDADGNPNTRPLSFTDAKTAVASQFKNDPVASMELKSNWVDMLNNHPVLSQVPGLSSDLQALNTKYAQTAKVNNYVYQKKIVDPKSGAINTENAVKEMQDYVKGTGNPNLPDALRTMGEDTPLGEPIPGATAHANQLEALSTQRQNNIAQHSSDTAARASQVEALAPAKAQAGLLADMDKGLDSKIQGRIQGVKGVGTAGAFLGGLGKMVGLFGAAPQLAGVALAYQAARLRPNSGTEQQLIDMLYQSATGNNLYQQQQDYSRISGSPNGVISNDDYNKLKQMGVPVA